MRTSSSPKLRHSYWRGCLVALAGVVLLFALLWWAQDRAMSLLAQRLLSGWGESFGGVVTFGEIRSGFFGPIVLRDVAFKSAHGSDLLIAEVEVEPLSPAEWNEKPRRWIKALRFEGVSGALIWPSGVTPNLDRRLISSSLDHLPWLPRLVALSDLDFTVLGDGWKVRWHHGNLLLDEDATGHFGLARAEVQVGHWRKDYHNLEGVTAWRDGTAYLADLVIGQDIMIDGLSLDLTHDPVLTLEAQVGGGYVYAEAASALGGIKVAANAFNLSLAEVATFLGETGEMEGTIDLAKLTFNGRPSQWLSGQTSLRLEVRDFVRQKSEVNNFTLGLSLAGRRVRVNELLLRQEANDVQLRGTVTIPLEPAAWRGAPFDFEVRAEVGDLQALSGLFGQPWDRLSGSVSLEGQGSGRGSDGVGWIKMRGWNLQAPGIPASTLQADLTLQGHDLKLTSLEAQSGPDFLRGAGRISLIKHLSYEGQLELRVREVARYLKPLGRLAPDWARQGGVLFFWDGDGAGLTHSGVASLELVSFTGDLNPVPINGQISASYSPGNVYVSRLLLDRGSLSFSSSLYLGKQGVSVQDIQLFNKQTRLLHGELFLPLSLEALLAGRSWEETMMADRDVYAFLRSDNLELGSLVQLFGQETSLRGRVDLRVDARGPWTDPVIDGHLFVAELQAQFPRFSLPISQGTLSLQVGQRLALVEAEWQPEGSSAITFRSELPLMGEVSLGTWTLFDLAAPWSAQLLIPSAELGHFLPQGCGWKLAAGRLQGEIHASNNLAEPHFEGSMALSKGHLQLPRGWGALEEIHGRVRCSQSNFFVEAARARMGEGALQLDGMMNFRDIGNPSLELLLRGEGLHLYDNDHLLLLAQANLEAKGNLQGGLIRGQFVLDGTQVRSNLQVAPQFGTKEGLLDRPFWDNSSSSLASWTLAIDLTATAPLSMGENDGKLHPKLSLSGSLGQPLLLGTIGVEKLDVFSPSGMCLLWHGAVYFTDAYPWMPYLDLTGVTEEGGYTLMAGAFGLVEAQRFWVSSSPRLSSEQIVLFLATGVSPVLAVEPEIGETGTKARSTADPSSFDPSKFGVLPPLGGAGSTENEEGLLTGYRWEFR